MWGPTPLSRAAYSPSPDRLKHHVWPSLLPNQRCGRAGTGRFGVETRVSNFVLASARSVMVMRSRTSRARWAAVPRSIALVWRISAFGGSSKAAFATVLPIGGVVSTGTEPVDISAPQGGEHETDRWNRFLGQSSTRRNRVDEGTPHPPVAVGERAGRFELGMDDGRSDRRGVGRSVHVVDEIGHRRTGNQW